MKILPTLRQLRFLVAVVDRRHFGKAAQDCLVGQSTLSVGVQELEALLGIKLLERNRRSVAPTPLGLEIANRARKILRDAQDLADAAIAAQDPLSGSLQLGVIPTVGPFVTPRIMPILHENFPNLKISLREEQTAPLLERLAGGRLDAVLLATPFALKNFDFFEIAKDRFCVVFPKTHRFARKKAIRPEDLDSEDLLLLEEGHCLRDHALAACSRGDARRNIAFQGTSLFTLAQMCAYGLGITFAPQIAIDAGFLRGVDVLSAPLAGQASYRRIALVWRRSSARTETFTHLAQTLKTYWLKGEPATPKPMVKGERAMTDRI